MTTVLGMRLGGDLPINRLVTVDHIGDGEGIEDAGPRLCLATNRAGLFYFFGNSCKRLHKTLGITRVDDVACIADQATETSNVRCDRYTSCAHALCDNVAESLGIT